MRRGGTAADVEQMLEDAKQQVREARSARLQGGAGSLYQSSGRNEESGGGALGGDGWEEDFRRVVQTIGDLEREDEGLRQARAKFLSGSRDRSKVAQFPDRPTRIVYAWNDPSQTAAALNQDATPPASQPAAQVKFDRRFIRKSIHFNTRTYKHQTCIHTYRRADVQTYRHTDVQRYRISI